jgi:hypothetical protein
MTIDEQIHEQASSFAIFPQKIAKAGAGKVP